MLLVSKVAGVLGFLLASVEDFKWKRLIPDYISFSLIIFGVGSGLIFSIVRESVTYFVNSLAGLAVGVLLGNLAFYTGQWGGADSKLLMAAGALIGIDVFSLSGVPLFLIFIFNLFLAGALFGLAWSLYLAIKNWDDFKEDFKKRLHSEEVSKFRKAMLAVSVVLLVTAFFVSVQYKVLLLGVIIATYFLTYLYVFSKTVEKTCMVVERKVGNLVEGDLIVEDVKKNGEKVMEASRKGLEEEDIEKLRESSVKKVKVLQGVPFAPCFLLGFIATITLGNWIVLLL